MKKRSNERPEALKPLANSKSAAHDNGRANNLGDDLGNESDVLSFWLLLLFVAVFFGIAAEEAQRSSFTTPFQSTTVGASMNPIPSPVDRKVKR